MYRLEVIHDLEGLIWLDLYYINFIRPNNGY